MSQERVLKALVSFGLTQTDAQVYIYLAKKGPQKGADAAKALKVQRQQFYRSLKNLENQGIVSATLEHPSMFSALPFEKALDLLAKAKMKKALEEAQRIKEEKNDLIANWQALNIGDFKDASAKFTVIEGRNNIYARIQQMIIETRTQISITTTVPSLIRADQFGLFEVGFQHPLKSQVKFRFLTELREQTVPQIKNLLKEMGTAGLNFEGRNPDLGLSLFPRMVIRDEDEILFFIRSATDTSTTEQDSTCIWTNCKDLVKAFIGVFNQLWQNSTDIQTKIEEIESGLSIYTSIAARDSETAKVNYVETLLSAKKEIIMMTSSTGLVNSWKNLNTLREETKRGVSIKIMAPISSNNLQAVQQLSEFCEVRHVPRSAIGATIIDGKHLFQFTNLSDLENHEVESQSESGYYVEDQKYVERMKGMLHEIWSNASEASSITLESIFQPPTTVAGSGSDTSKLEMIKKDQATIFANSGFRSQFLTVGLAVIHPPANLNLLDMVIHVQKSTKEAAFGASDTVIVYLCLQIPGSSTHAKPGGGFSPFVPLAIINNNPRSSIMFKELYRGTPAAQNIILAKPHQLEEWTHGNMLFAGWTIPIPLLAPKYSLPPSCILFEGIGESKHKTKTLTSPSGFKITSEYDYSEAFVTFITPSAKYSGPGTDGSLRTNIVTVTTPP